MVVELSEMTSAEAHAFLDRRRDECVSMRINERDEVILRDVPREPIVARVAANARPMILVAAMMAAACEPGAATEGGRSDARAVAADAGGVESGEREAGPGDVGEAESATTVGVDASTNADAGGAVRARKDAHPPVRRLGGSPPVRKPEVLGGY